MPFAFALRNSRFLARLAPGSMFNLVFNSRRCFRANALGRAPRFFFDATLMPLGSRGIVVACCGPRSSQDEAIHAHSLRCGRWQLFWMEGEPTNEQTSKQPNDPHQWSCKPQRSTPNERNKERKRKTATIETSSYDPDRCFDKCFVVRSRSMR